MSEVGSAMDHGCSEIRGELTRLRYAVVSECQDSRSKPITLGHGCTKIRGVCSDLDERSEESRRLLQ